VAQRGRLHPARGVEPDLTVALRLHTGPLPEYCGWAVSQIGGRRRGEVIRTSRVTSWLAALVVTVVVVAACGQAAVSPGQSTGANPPSEPGPTGADPSAPVVDGVDPAGSMVALELGLRKADRERAGLVNLGPGAMEFAAAMDANVARGLVELRGGATSDSLGGQLAGPGLGPLLVGPEYNSMLAWATTMVVLDDLIRDPRNGTVEMDPETVEIAGNTGTITTTMTVKTVVSGSKASVDITVKSKGKVVDRATGAILYSIDSEASAHIDLDFHARQPSVARAARSRSRPACGAR
jgi:hypothetical protein